MKRLLEFRKPRTGELLSFRSRQYYVSEDGQIWNDERKRYVKQWENHNGYMHVHLRDDNGKQHTSIRVHTLVATCFIRLLENGEEVHHINHDRQENRLDNLEIIDGKEHTRQHTIENWKNGTMDGISVKMRKAWTDGTYDGISEKFRNVGISRPAKAVAQLGMDGHLVRVWPSTNEAGRNGFDKGAVSSCCNGKRISHKGFKWQNLEDFQKHKEEASHLEQLASE